jgi:hypothetical protein
MYKTYEIINGDLYLKSTDFPQNPSVFSFYPNNIIVTEASQILGTYALISGITDVDNIEDSFTYTIDNTYTFTKSSLIGATRNINTNPKLLSQDFTELNIVDSSGNSFTYDKQKIGQKDISFLYTEPIIPEITRSYLRLKAPVGLYEDGTNENYMGLVSSIDNSLPIANTRYAEFLANNKNFYMQTAQDISKDIFGIITSAASSAGAGAALGAAAGSIIPGVGTAIGAGVGAGLGTLGALAGASNSLASNGLNFYFNTKNKFMSIDNMRNAPGSVKNANGNPIFNMYINDISMFVEEYDALENDKKQLDDIMYLTGFAYDRLDNIRNYDNIRHYFNFVQANIESFNGLSISNQIRDDLKVRFANGVRFWNQDNIDYTMENYEKWLNNEE